MKKIIYSFLCAGFLGLTSCEDFLKEEPRSEMGTEQNFSFPSQAKSAVNQLYRTGVPSFYNAGSAYMGPTIMLGGYLSGFFDNEYKGQEVIILYSQNLTIDSKNIANQLDGVWDACYTAISRANNAVKYIPSTPGLSEAEQKQLLGEAKFFRAMNYFHLVKFFGDVPLITEPYEALTDFYIARTPSAEVYNFIVSDLKYAVEEGGLADASFPANGFRVSKGSAEALLADVYLNMSGYPLQQNKYADAASVTRAIINSGKYKLIENGTSPAQSAYNKMRTSDTEDEYLYSIEYLAGIADNGWRPTYSFPNKAATWGIFKYSITCNAYRPVQQILNVYDPATDLRVQEKQFFHSSYTFVKAGNTITENFDVTPYLWYDEDALLNTGKGSKDVAVYRYAEVLLIAAEAIAQAEGVNNEAAGYLADVRSRAYTTKTKAEIVAELISLSKDAFITEVWTERLREFPLENKIWSDIQRTRLYPQTTDTDKGKVNFVNVIGAQNPWGKTFEEKHLLWPLSDNERQRNPKLTQNPGY